MSESSVQAPARPQWWWPFPSVRPGTLPFWGVHVFAVAGVVYSGFSWTGVAWALGSYLLRMFFITAGYHRYFSHRTFKTSRVGQFVLAFMAETSVQKGVLWWAAWHRAHHRYSDRPGDPHSARERGLWWSHAGWILSREHNVVREDLVPDLVKYPEIRWISRNYLVAVVLYAAAFFLVGGWTALLWGFFVSTVITWHGTFTINSLTHVFGRARFNSGDDSKNSWTLALITLGEGWHNNHHHYQASVNQGFYWWELDVTYQLLRVASWFGLVWDLRKPPRRVLEQGKSEKLEVEPEHGVLSML